jgi:hypothetical protein
MCMYVCIYIHIFIYTYKPIAEMPFHEVVEPHTLSPRLMIAIGGNLVKENFWKDDEVVVEGIYI